MVRNTYIYPPKPSMRVISDIFGYTSTKMPKYNSISISGYHIQEAGATADLELAYTLADGVEYLKAALDEALALPTDFSARIARNTQLLLQQESGTTRPIDPWGGSYYVEWLTHQLAEKARAHIREVAEHGGMAQAISDGIPKLRIEEAAARTQARIDSGQQTVIGVNKYRVDADEAIEVLKVDNADVLAQQTAKLEELRASRDAGAVQDALRRLTDAARAAAEGRRDSSLDANLLKLAVDAARAKATVGEISDALEQVYRRHAGQVRTI